MRFYYRTWRCSKKQYFYCWLTFIFIFIFYTEFYTYIENTSTWLEPKCENQKDCTKILFVADPQIIGERKEIIHFITPFSIIDSDFYLKKTYYWAFRFAQPDIVVFLGDLMDEGSIAKDSEFYGYVRRIFDIFLDKSASDIKHIWLPGDNDIGGEEFDGVTKQKLKRFHRAFAQPDLIVHKNLTFFKINRLTQSIPVFKDNREFYDTSRIFIGLSHLPLMFMPSLFVEKVNSSNCISCSRLVEVFARVLNKMLPQVMFTAHEHKSMIISTDALLRQDRQIIPVTPDNNKIHEYTLGNTDMYEFIIPTCSYRMGTDKIGYGFAVLERNQLRYTVLWSPSRFKQLFSYLILVCFVFLSLCFHWCCCRKNSFKRFT